MVRFRVCLQGFCSTLARWITNETGKFMFYPSLLLCRWTLIHRRCPPTARLLLLPESHFEIDFAPNAITSEVICWMQHIKCERIDLDSAQCLTFNNSAPACVKAYNSIKHWTKNNHCCACWSYWQWHLGLQQKRIIDGWQSHVAFL